MARLTIKPTAAPDFSGTSNILRNAGESFDKGISAASGLLEQYQAGQQQIGDAELNDQLSSITTEDELNKFFASNPLKGRNLSPAMRQNVLEFRNGILDNEQTRSNTQLTNTIRDGNRINSSVKLDQNDRDQALADRQAAEYTDKVNVRNTKRNLSSTAINAVIEGRDEGRGLLPDGSRDVPVTLFDTESSGNFGASNNEIGSGGKKGHFGRVQFSVNRLIEAKNSGAIPRDMTTEQFLSNPEAQIKAENWHFADIQNHISRFGERFIGQEINGIPVTRDGLVAVAHLGGKEGMKKFLNSGGEYNPQDSFGTSLSEYLEIHAGNSTARAKPRGQNNDALEQALINDTTLTTDEKLKLLDTARIAQNQGEATIASDRAKDVQEITAASVLESAQNPDNINTRSVNKDVLDSAANSGFTAVEQLGAINTSNAVSQSDALKPLVSPNVSLDPVINATIDNDKAIGNRSVATMPQTRIYERVREIDSDPVGALMEQFQISGEPGFLENQINYREQLNRVVRAVARENGVTESEAAVALSENFYGNDTWGFDDIEDRFYIDKAKSFIETNFSEEARTRFNDINTRNRLNNAEIDANALALKNLKTKAAKYPEGQVPEGIKSSIRDLEERIINGASSAEGDNLLRDYVKTNNLESRLSGLDPFSPAYELAIREIEGIIKSDDSLDERNKSLLISSIRG